MLNEVEPAAELSGGLIKADPIQQNAILSIMDHAYDYVGNEPNVDTKKLVSKMKQLGAASPDEHGIQHFKDEDYQKLIEVMIFDDRIVRKPDGCYRALNTQYQYALSAYQK